jgi:hypothetical protein
MTTTTHTLDLAGVGPVDVTVDEYGEGRPFVLLHGGGGPDTVAGFAQRLATTHHARAINPFIPASAVLPARRRWTACEDSPPSM